MTPQQPFLETLYHLRTVEHVILYNKVEVVPAAEEKATLEFLESEYERESADYPGTAPAFNAPAAIWGAKTMYFAAQLYLYREDKANELAQIVPPFQGILDASAMLSADLCLRFLPQIVHGLELLDAADALLPILHNYLKQFHYSAIGSDLDTSGLSSDAILNNACLKQLYLDRINERQVIKWAHSWELREGLAANFGHHQALLWPAYIPQQE